VITNILAPNLIFVNRNRKKNPKKIVPFHEKTAFLMKKVKIIQTVDAKTK